MIMFWGKVKSMWVG